MKEIKLWWNKAKDDLEKAEIMLENKKYDGAVFYCQQSVEKALKSLLLKKRKEIIKIHDLVKLSNEVNLPEKLKEYAKEITQAYIYSRYPDIEIPSNIKKIASNFITYSKEILKWIEKQL